MLIVNDNQSIDAWQGSTGNFLWHYRTSSHILWYPEVIDNLIYIRSFNGIMDVLRITDGTHLWRYPFPPGK
jgi:outer membrane protein assembly factor BamB